MRERERERDRHRDRVIRHVEHSNTIPLILNATHCNTLQRTATHCNRERDLVMRHIENTHTIQLILIVMHMWERGGEGAREKGGEGERTRRERCVRETDTQRHRPSHEVHQEPRHHSIDSYCHTHVSRDLLHMCVCVCHHSFACVCVCVCHGSFTCACACRDSFTCVRGCHDSFTRVRGVHDSFTCACRTAGCTVGSALMHESNALARKQVQYIDAVRWCEKQCTAEVTHMYALQ